MKYNELKVGLSYITKIGKDYREVILINLREEFNKGKKDKDKEVIVLTSSRNQIYRTANQLKSQR